jgi:hypothetical protein
LPERRDLPDLIRVVAGHVLEVDVQWIVGGIDLDLGDVAQRAFLDQLADNKANAPIRREFQLPADRPFTA